MSLYDEDPVTIALRVGVVVLSLGAVVLGVRVAVTRRFPAAWVRLARLEPGERSQPVQVGIAQAMIGAGLLIPQAPFFISMPLPLGRALFAVSLLLLLTAAGAFSLQRR
jgi:drug/metabolite transporter (DMT)-like permease